VCNNLLSRGPRFLLIFQIGRVFKIFGSLSPRPVDTRVKAFAELPALSAEGNKT